MGRLWLLLTMLAGCDGGLTYYDKAAAPLIDPDLPATTPTSSTAPSSTTPEADTATTPTDTGSTSTSTTTTTSTTLWVNGDPDSPPPWSTTNPPPLVLAGPCSTVGTATSVPDGSGIVLVESPSDNSEIEKELQAASAGWFDLYDLSLANDGVAERNEIARVRVSNATWAGDSVYANCGTDWVAPDSDNAADPGSILQYLGTFWFEVGPNTLDLLHFCPSIRAGVCPELEDLSDPASTCASGDDNDVGMVATGLCLVAPAPEATRPFRGYVANDERRPRNLTDTKSTVMTCGSWAGCGRRRGSGSAVDR